MRLFNVILVNILLIGGLTVSTCNKAKAGELPQNQKAKAISTEIREKVNFPDELLDTEINEKVTVEFKVKTDKTIEVVSVNSANEFLKTYVKKQIESLNLISAEGFEGKVLEISLLFSN
ncbi:MAG: hypothetical protein K9H61_07155 [Bacteroidia bacterium]|nr:hypothetical protein [Bacteroidia bacterium]MCF8426585.1 hypothetical protein [Bacteroidia bacterium]MCF8446757.1 hypothetical protein [Bacteroidia bacterium]